MQGIQSDAVYLELYMSKNHICNRTDKMNILNKIYIVTFLLFVVFYMNVLYMSIDSSLAKKVIALWLFFFLKKQSVQKGALFLLRRK